MRTFRATGISLTVKKYRGTQRLVVFYTPERGKVEAVAQGVGKPGSKLASLVEPLTLSRLFFASGRQLDRLTEGEVVNAFYELRSDLRRFAYASYVAELTAQATEPGLPMPPVFVALQGSLELLAGGAPPAMVAWGFALRLLHHLGVGLVAQRCVHCGAPLAGRVSYSAAAGGLLCGDCRSTGTALLAVSGGTAGLLGALASFPLERLPRVSCPPASQAEIAEVVHRHVAYHLGFVPVTERFIREVEQGGC